MDQDALALLQSGEVVQRVIYRHDGYRERRSLLEAHGRRFFEQTVRGRNDMGRERITGDAEHGVPRAKVIDSITNRNDFARKLHAQGRTREPTLERFLRQHPDALQDVPKVETGRPDMRGNLPGSGPRDRDPLQDRALLRFSLREGQFEPDLVVGRHARRAARFPAPSGVHSAPGRVIGLRPRRRWCSNSSTSASPAAAALASGSRSISRQEISARSLMIVRVRPQSGACHGRTQPADRSGIGIAPDVTTVSRADAASPAAIIACTATSRSKLPCRCAVSGSEGAASAVPRRCRI